MAPLLWSRLFESSRYCCIQTRAVIVVFNIHDVFNWRGKGAPRSPSFSHRPLFFSIVHASFCFFNRLCALLYFQSSRPKDKAVPEIRTLASTDLVHGACTKPQDHSVLG